MVEVERGKKSWNAKKKKSEKKVCLDNLVDPKKKIFFCMSRHFVLAVAGGASGTTFGRLMRVHCPEYTEWQTTARVIHDIRQNALCDGKTKQVIVKTLFGPPTDGFPKLRTFTGVYRGAVDAYKRLRNTTARTFPRYVDVPDDRIAKYHVSPATTRELNKALQGLVQQVQTGDRVTLFLEGHGSMHGVQLWNDFLSRHFVSKEMLRDTIQRLPPSVQVRVIVNSCYSGQFLDLTDTRTTVFTSADAHHPSYYTPMGKAWPVLVRWQDPKQRLKSFHVHGNQGSNCRASHSLDWWLDQKLLVLSGRSRMRIETTETFWNMRRWAQHPRLAFATEVAFLSLIILDSSGVVAKLVQAKFLLACTKVGVSTVKLLLVFRVCASKIHAFLAEHIPGYEQWRYERMVRRDYNLLRDVSRQADRSRVDGKLISCLTPTDLACLQLAVTRLQYMDDLAHKSPNWDKSLQTIGGLTRVKLTAYFTLRRQLSVEEQAKQQLELFSILHNVGVC